MELRDLLESEGVNVSDGNSEEALALVDWARTRAQAVLAGGVKEEALLALLDGQTIESPRFEAGSAGGGPEGELEAVEEVEELEELEVEELEELEAEELEEIAEAEEVEDADEDGVYSAEADDGADPESSPLASDEGAEAELNDALLGGTELELDDEDEDEDDEREEGDDDEMFDIDLDDE